MASSRPFRMTEAREHAGRAAPTSSRSDAIQSSAMSEALQNLAASPPKYGVLALATALDDARSGTRPPSRPHKFPLRRNPKLRQAGALQNIATSPPKYRVLALARLRPLWMTHARDHALSAAPASSRSNAIQSSGKPEALQNTAASSPKFGVLALATALDDARSGTRPLSRSDEFPFRRGPKLRQAGSTPKHSRHSATQVWSAVARGRFG